MLTLAQRIDDLESRDQRRAVRDDQRCVVLARPGSGKTHTLVLKTAFLLGHEVAAPQKVACITYMNDAVSEIYERLELLGIEDDKRLFVGTLHRFCFNAIIHPFKDVFLKHLPSPLAIADEDTQQECWAEAEIYYSSDVFRLKQIRREAVLGKRQKAPKADVKSLNLYRQALYARGLIDFDDIANYAFSLIKNHIVVRNHVVATYPWLVIDEYQDLGEVFNALVQELVDNTKINFFIVGDPNQSIMGFQGAAPDYLRTLATKSGVNSVHLSITRRCFPSIISIANRLSADQILPHPSRNGGREAQCLICPQGFKEQVERIIEIISNEQSEKIPLGQIAILCRAGYPTIDRIAEQLSNSNIAFAGSRDQRYERTPLIRLLEDIALWTISGWSNGKPKFERIYRRYKLLYLTHEIQSPFMSELDMQQQFFHVLLQIRSHKDILLREWLDYISSPDGLYLSQIIEAIRGNELYLASSFDKLKQNVAQQGKLEAMTLADFALCGRSAESVFLSTLHSSKGLEFETVIIPEMEQGILPDYRDLRGSEEEVEAQIAEARRLLYVGITRARSSIYLLYSGKYERYSPQSNKTITFNNGPSQFLQEIGLI